MSKCNRNNTKKPAKSINTIQRKLSEVGLTVEDVKKWIETGSIESADEEYPDDQELFSFLGVEKKEKKSQSCVSCEDLVEENAKDYFEYLESVGGKGDMNTWLKSIGEFETGSYRPSKTSNTGKVSFKAGKTAEDTEVYVGNLIVEGVCRAVLEYDTDLNIPKLTLEIMNPTVN